MDNKKIEKYYDYTLKFYKFFWHGKTNAIHYALWDENTKSHKEALLNFNLFLAKLVNIKKNDLVLDAGCGIGGSSIWLAQNYQAKVIGITISKKQLEKARKVAKKNKVDHLVNFYLQDFTKTKFKTGSFDVVWALESACYAENKKDFLKEAFRLLNNNGKLIIADGFLKRKPKNKEEEKILSDFTKGLMLPNLAKINRLQKDMKTVGFTNLRVLDVTEKVTLSINKLHRMCKWGYSLAKITQFLKLTPPLLTHNNLAGIVQKKGVDIGLFGYNVFYGEKKK